jgi:hypothetical protein
VEEDVDGTYRKGTQHRSCRRSSWKPGTPLLIVWFVVLGVVWKAEGGREVVMI